MFKLIEKKSQKTASLIALFLLAACSNDIEQEAETASPDEAQEQASTSTPAPQDTQPAAAEENPTQRHQVLQEYLNTYLHRTQASDIQHCATFAYGYNPCGGPARYVVYSQENMNEDDIAELESRAEEFMQLDTFVKSTQQVVGACVVTEEPEVALRNGHCRAENQSFRPVNR